MKNSVRISKSKNLKDIFERKKIGCTKNMYVEKSNSQNINLLNNVCTPPVFCFCLLTPMILNCC